MTVVFSAAGLQARALRADEVPTLQAFYDANPSYFIAINGRPAPPDAAGGDFDERPPPHLAWSRRWLLGLFDAAGTIAGVVDLVSDLGVAGVWHLALFMLASDRHGRGEAPACHAALEAWIRGQGAQWLRLGVVAGNARAERFWARQGYLETRVREGIDTGGRVNTVRVLVKPLVAVSSPLAAYRGLVARDRPGSDLP
jgi:GNAT superfamily N-acetyltransferase